MATSQNGWRANDRSVITTYTVPGTNVKLPCRQGAPGELLIAAAARWHREVEPLVAGHCWGYAERNIRGSATTLSNHASGTAIDLNAPAHPLGTNPSANFSAAQIAAVRRIMADTRGVLRWGGEYVSRKDGMHLEVMDGKTDQDCRNALSWIGASSAGSAPPPAAQPSSSGDVLRRGSKGPAVAAWQNHCNVMYTRFRPALVADGDFGQATENRTKEIQTFRGLTADGIVGPDTRRATNFNG